MQAAGIPLSAGRTGSSGFADAEQSISPDQALHAEYDELNASPYDAPPVQLGFEVWPGGGSIAQAAFPVELRGADLAAVISEALDVPVEHVVVRLGGVWLPPEARLLDAGLRPGDIGRGEVMVDPHQTGDGYVLPPVTLVLVRDEDTGDVLSTVEVGIEVAPEAASKPMLGGFRDKRNGLVYHHASTQTPGGLLRQSKQREPQFTRATQTVHLSTRSTQTKREASTQMTRHDVFVDDREDVHVAPTGSYFTADQLDAVRDGKALILQCAWRSSVARDRATKLRVAEVERVAAEEAELQTAQAAAAAEVAAAEQRRKNPRSASDFAALYNEVEAWRADTSRQIKDAVTLTPAQRAEEHSKLLARETRMLQTLDKLKVTASVENRTKRITKMLDAMAEPRKWELADGEVASVHTPFTTRAMELKNLYVGLVTPTEGDGSAAAAAAAATGGATTTRMVDSGRSAPGESKTEQAESPSVLSTQERLDVLLHVKWTVKEFDCQLSRDIVELIDREADLLNRGRSARSLRGLRTRLANKFLQFAETPEFNPQAAAFMTVPPEMLKRPDIAPANTGVGKRPGGGGAVRQPLAAKPTKR